MTAARRARNERRATARRSVDVMPATVVLDPAIAARRAITGMLLRGLVLVILTAAGLLLTYGAFSMSPYTQASLPMLIRAIIAHAVFAGVYAWYVHTASRFIPLAVAGLSAAALVIYLWRIGNITS